MGQRRQATAYFLSVEHPLYPGLFSQTAFARGEKAPSVPQRVICGGSGVTFAVRDPVPVWSPRQVALKVPQYWQWAFPLFSALLFSRQAIDHDL